MISRFTSKCNFVHALQKITALSEPIFTKLANIQQYYMQTTHTDFRPHRTINVEIADTKSFAHLSKRAALTTCIVTNTALAEQHCVKIYT